MKKLIVLLVLLAGCTSVPKERPVRAYECGIIGGHGNLVHLNVNASYREEAEIVTEEVRIRLVRMNKIPAETVAMCFLKEEN